MSSYLSPTAATVIGLIGSAIVLAAFAYANSTEKMDPLRFNMMNLAGAALLMISLSVQFNLAAFVLEAAWAAIALWGIARALKRRGSAA